MEQYGKENPVGIVQMPWSCAMVLPLEKAHQLQILLLEAWSYTEHGYSDGKKFAYISRFEVPPVATPSIDRPIYDATMLSKTEANEWAHTVSKGMDEDSTARSDTLLSPELWRAMA